MRLTTTNQGQFGLHIDVENPGDEVVKHKGKKLLLVASGLASSLEGVILDVEYTPDDPELSVFKEYLDRVEWSGNSNAK